MWARNRRLAALLVMALFVDAAAALSAELAQPPQQKPSCGASVTDALNEASHFLNASDAQAEHKALVCLIEAVRTLNAQKSEAVRKDGTDLIYFQTDKYPVP